MSGRRQWERLSEWEYEATEGDVHAVLSFSVKTLTDADDSDMHERYRNKVTIIDVATGDKVVVAKPAFGSDRRVWFAWANGELNEYLAKAGR